MSKRLGFFTRLLDEATAAERYRLATAQIVQAERCGFDSAWIAQQHFHPLGAIQRILHEIASVGIEKIT